MALQNLRSNTANKRPTASGMVDGQVAINTNATNPGLFFKDAGDGIRKVGPVFIGSSAPNGSPAVGGSTGHSIGEQWLDTSGSRYVVKTWDGTAWRDDDSNYLQLTGGALSGALTIDNAANVAALDLKFDGDTDTGFYAPAANTLGFVGGGTERLRIDSSGRVGIGNTAMGSLTGNAANNLVVGPGNANAGITVYTGTGNYGSLTFADGTSGDAQYRGYITYHHSGDSMRFNTAATEAMRIDSSGNVGVGTTSPSKHFVISSGGAAGMEIGAGNASANGGTLIEHYNRSSSAYVQARSIASDFLFNAGSNTFAINSSGNVGIGTTSPFRPVHVSGSNDQYVRITSTNSANAGVEFGDSDDPGRANLIYSNSADSMLFTVNGSERVRIDSSGNVGIGTTSPSQLLHLEGSNAGANIQVQSRAFFGGQYSNHFPVIGSAVRVDTGQTTGMVSTETSSGNGRPSAIRFGAGAIEFHSAASSTAGAAFNSERMRIDSSGRVGIGTSSPSRVLQIKAPSANTAHIALIDNDSSNEIWQVGNQSDGDGFMALRTDGGTTSVLFDASGTNYINGGDLGIGTTSPGSKVHVFDSNPEVRLQSSGTSTTCEYSMLGRDGSNVAHKVNIKTSDSALTFGTGGSSGNSYVPSERMRIDSSGRVGIGTTSPTGYIHIEGESTGTETYGRFTTGPANGDQSLVIKSGSNRDHMALQVSTNAGANDDLSLQPDGGNVGIGTTSPSSYGGAVKLAVASTSNTSFSIASGTSSDGTILFADGTSGDATYRGQVKYSHSSDAMLFNTAATERLRIDSSGNVGIGTSQPSFTEGSGLRVERDTTATLRLQDTGHHGFEISASTDDAKFRTMNNKPFVFADGADNIKMQISSSSGQVAIGTSSIGTGALTVYGASTARAMFQGSSTGTGDAQGFTTGNNGGVNAFVWNYENGNIRFATSNSERMRIDDSGRVGIGTTSPSTTLSIGASASSSYNGGVCLNRGSSTYNFYEASDGTNSVIFGLDNTLTVAKIGSVNSYPIGFFTGNSERMRIDSSGNVGIGTTPEAWESGQFFALQIGKGGALYGRAAGDEDRNGFTSNCYHSSAGWKYIAASAHATRYDQSDGNHIWFTAGTGSADAAVSFSERMRIDSSGNVGIGTSSPAAKLDVAGNQIFTAANPQIQFNAGGPIIRLPGANILAFLTDSTNERMRLTGNGLGIGTANYSDNFISTVGNTNKVAIASLNAHNTALCYYGVKTTATSTSDTTRLDVYRSATSAYNFMVCDSNTLNANDREFTFRGDGYAFADGTWNNNGADYAEFFESSTGAAIPVGTTVVLDNNKVRAATADDSASAIMGVVRPKEPGQASMTIGNTAWNKWHGKYLTDDFDRFILDEHVVYEWTEEVDDGDDIIHSYESHQIPDGITVPDDVVGQTHDAKGNRFVHYRLNPDYDPDMVYVPREDRDEWVIVGLIGQVKVLDGQPMNDRWIKMRDVSDAVEEWFIR